MEVTHHGVKIAAIEHPKAATFNTRLHRNVIVSSPLGDCDDEGGGGV